MNVELTQQAHSIVKPARQRRSRGAASVEYVILLCVIVAAGILLWQKFGKDYTDRIKGATEQFDKVQANGGGE
jgi:hypothetical protein